MNKEIKQEWTEALRSGKYEQGFRRLRSADDKFCCLGVLCDIVDPDGWASNQFEDWFTADNEKNYPPQKVRDASELFRGQAKILAGMNDSGATFVKIAEYIEATL